jgi:ATP-binding protein involved in chromosome partitioning
MSAPHGTIDREHVLQALGTVMDPDLNRDLVSLNMIRDLAIEGDAVSLRVVLTTPACPMKDKIRNDVETALAKIGVHGPQITMDAEVRKPVGPAQAQPDARLPGVGAVIAVASGKGGVGKSTVATNLALSLSKAGATVGLLDADIYGPSMPVMFGLKGAEPEVVNEGGKASILPLKRHGVAIMSMGFMLEDDQAVVWRGPMLGKALQQFIEDVNWGPLDYLIIDMPPGTGDVALSLAQLVPVSGAVVVTTPQDVAFADVRRAIRMFTMTKTPILGLIENMSHFVCDGCDKTHEIFGSSQIEAHASQYDLEVLGRMPLDGVTAVAADKGEPIVVSEPDGPQAAAYFKLAQRVAQKLAVDAAKTETPSEKFSNFFQMKS